MLRLFCVLFEVVLVESFMFSMSTGICVTTGYQRIVETFSFMLIYFASLQATRFSTSVMDFTDLPSSMALKNSVPGNLISGIFGEKIASNDE
jgi:hypothetical protein